MKKEDGREILKQAVRNVDWHNLGIMCYTLGVSEQGWNKFVGSKSIPDYEKAWNDLRYLKENIDEIYLATRNFKYKKFESES